MDAVFSRDLKRLLRDALGRSRNKSGMDAADYQSRFPAFRFRLYVGVQVPLRKPRRIDFKLNPGGEPTSAVAMEAGVHEALEAID